MIKNKHVWVWLGISILCLIILSGRYDWRYSFAESKVSYICSAFFLVISLPVCYYLFFDHLGNLQKTTGITSVFAMMLVLAYRWLGLEEYSINNTFQNPSLTVNPKFDWFPAAFFHSAIPHERKFFFFLFLLGIGITVILWRRKSIPNKLLVLGLFAYVLVLIQAWLHLSLRSPASYAGSLFGPNAWPVIYLFPGEQGAVNGDYPLHRGIEELFMGTPEHLHFLFIRRSFYYYLTSQFSYFFHPYYVVLLLNIGLWFYTVICGYKFVSQIWDEQVGLIAAGLISCGTGFIYFVAQSTSYLAGYALYFILIHWFQTIVVKKPDCFGSSLLFGAILGLGPLVYEVTIPIYIFILDYGLLSHVKWQNLLSIVLLGILIHFGYIILIGNALHQSLDSYPYQAPTIHIGERINLILNGDSNKIYLLLTQLVVLFWGGLGNAFFVIPVFISVFALLLVRGYHKTLIILLLLVMPFFWTVLFHSVDMRWLDVMPYSTWPRYLYVGYPAIYILVALVLVRLNQNIVRIKHHDFHIGKIISYFVLVGIFVLNNMDILGIQSPYFFVLLSGTYIVEFID